jgi:hypothetical protein
MCSTMDCCGRRYGKLGLLLYDDLHALDTSLDIHAWSIASSSSVGVMSKLNN